MWAYGSNLIWTLLGAFEDGIKVESACKLIFNDFGCLPRFYLYWLHVVLIRQHQSQLRPAQVILHTIAFSRGHDYVKARHCPYGRRSRMRRPYGSSRQLT